MISLLLSFVASDHIGLDIGGEHLRAILFRSSGKMEILSSREAERIFPTILTIVPKNKPIPDVINYTDVPYYDFVFNDMNAIRKYPNSTIRYWKAFLAKISTKEMSSMAISRRLWGTPSIYTDARLLISGILPETILFRTLGLINKTVSTINKNKIDSLFISVPKYYPQSERDIIRTISKKNGYKAYIVDSTKASETYFAFENMKFFARKPKNVLFIDIGSTKTEIYLANFTNINKTQIDELVYQFDDTVGGRDIDIIIAKMLEKQFPFNITARIEQVIIEEAVKIKHRLTTDKQVVGNIEAIDGENDLSYKITREDFEKELTPIFDKLRGLAKNITEYHIDRIQVMGGTCRIPAIQVFIQDLFGIKNIAYSMQQEETMSKAVSYYGCVEMPTVYHVPKINFNPLQLYGLRFRDENRGIIEFTEKITEPKILWLQFTSLYRAPNGRKQYPIGSSTYAVWAAAVNGTFLNKTRDGLWRFQNANGRVLRSWRPQLLSVAVAVEDQEEAGLRLKEAVNALESLIIDVRTACDSEDAAAVAPQREVAAVRRAADAVDKWFIKQRDFDYDEVRRRLDYFAASVSTLMARVQHVQALESSEANFSRAENILEKEMKRWASMRPSRRPHRQDIRNLIREHAIIRTRLDERRKAATLASPFDAPPLPFFDVDKAADQILSDLQRVAEPPKPQAKEKNSPISVKNTELSVK